MEIVFLNINGLEDKYYSGELDIGWVTAFFLSSKG